jgi:hypothetical protein
MSFNTASVFSNRLKLTFSVIAVLILLGGFAKSLQSEVVQAEKTTHNLVPLVDSNFSIAFTRLEDKAADLDRRVDTLEKANLAEAVAQTQQRVESMYFIMKCVAGAIFSMAAKDIFLALIAFLKNKPPIS